MKISLPNFSAFLESGSKWRVTIWWTQWTTLECASSSFVQFMSRYKCISSIPYAQSNICLFKARPSKNFSHLFCKHTAANTLFVSNLHFKRNFYNVKKTYLINWFCWKNLLDMGVGTKLFWSNWQQEAALFIWIFDKYFRHLFHFYIFEKSRSNLCCVSILR